MIVSISISVCTMYVGLCVYISMHGGGGYHQGGWVPCWCLSFTIFTFKKPFLALKLHLFVIFTSSNYQSSLSLPSLLWFSEFFISIHLKKNQNRHSLKKTGTPSMFDLIKTAIQLNQHDEDRRITLRRYSMRQMITWLGLLSLTGS